MAKKSKAKGKKGAKATKRAPKAKASAKAKSAKAKAKPAAKAKAKAKAAPKKKAAGKAAPKPTKTTAVEVAASGGSRAQLQTEILAMAKELYGDLSDAELLALDPNNIDEMDPSMFYELLQEKYGVQPDENNDCFGGFGGKISKTIEFIAARWDGKSKTETPTRPADWLETYVHPAAKEATGGGDDEQFAD